MFTHAHIYIARMEVEAVTKAGFAPKEVDVHPETQNGYVPTVLSTVQGHFARQKQPPPRTLH